MFQGTGSDVGKSLIVAGLARAYTRRGLKVMPFKPQNMSNNAAVTPDGGEIGRAQALQARAAGVATSVHMNPVLLKPQSETGAQVVVQGVVIGTARARDYYAMKRSLLPRVLESYAHITAHADLVLIEGAGSAAEVNLRDADIANMGFAEAADVPVILIGDIDRGGVIASIVGTHALVRASECARIKGYLINKFRGDISLFDPAIHIMTAKTGWPCFGVVPYCDAARALPKEDAMALDNAETTTSASERPLRVAVPRLSRIANFDDLDPLIAEPDVVVSVVEPGTAIPGNADLVLLPGSKSTVADLAFVRAQGWDVDILAHARRGGFVVGLCGGYQMLGHVVGDPDGIEGVPGALPGLGLLDVTTVMGGDKALQAVEGSEIESGAAVHGYEMHMGLTEGADCARAWLELEGGRAEGAMRADGRVFGSYVHGLFAADGFRAAFLKRLRGDWESSTAFEHGVEHALDALADHLEKHLDLDGLLKAARSA